MLIIQPDKEMGMIQHYSTNIYPETQIHYQKENKYPEGWKAKAYADMLTSQKSMANQSAQILNHIKIDQLSTTEALPQK
jgi:hypothetical protein